MDEPNGESIAVGVVKIACVLFLGVIILNNFDISSGANNIQNEAIITFTGEPVDGDTITLDSHVFEFDIGDGVAEGHIPVIIGDLIVETKDNLSVAIAENTNYEV